MPRRMQVTPVRAFSQPADFLPDAVFQNRKVFPALLADQFLNPGGQFFFQKLLHSFRQLVKLPAPLLTPYIYALQISRLS